MLTIKLRLILCSSSCLYSVQSREKDKGHIRKPTYGCLYDGLRALKPEVLGLGIMKKGFSICRLVGVQKG